MESVAFKMKLLKNCAVEYRKRHDEIWPELVTLLKNTGISDYVIYLDEETDILFASLKIEDRSMLDFLPDQEIMKKWWAYMADIMETNEDRSPVSTSLKNMFYLP